MKAGTGPLATPSRRAVTSTPVTSPGSVRSTEVSSTRVCVSQRPKRKSPTSRFTAGVETVVFAPAWAIPASSAPESVTAGAAGSISCDAAASAAASAAFWSCVRPAQTMPTSMAREPAAMSAASATTTVIVVVPERRATSC